MEQHCAWRLRIIEYAWAHNMIDVCQDVGDHYWPHADWGMLKLEESWLVRVVSVQVYNMVKSRQTHHYERVLGFLEHTHTLLPSLVPAIKHMKIVFGLKTMVIMWMLTEGVGPVDVVQKTMKYFPSKLTQYEDHCEKHELYRMRRNQLDFRTFAQSLIMDKQRLMGYIQYRMEEEYGDHYAQKTEERLLHYLRELNKALPSCTYIDTIVMKNSPVNEEEKALLQLITNDSTTTATRLRRMLLSDAACFSLSKSHLGIRSACVGTSKENLTPAAEKNLQLDCSVTDEIISVIDRPGLQATCVRAAETDNIKESCLKNSLIKASPHFCSKHQRWVQNILCECPTESSEEQPHDEISPLLFRSTSSSSDLTPSDLSLPPQHHSSPSTSNQFQEAEEHVSVPVDLDSPLCPAPLAVESFIPVGNVLEVDVPRTDVTSDSSTRGSSATHQRYSQSQNLEENEAKKVQCSSRINLTNGGMDAPLSTAKRFQTQSGSVDHIENSHDIIFHSNQILPCVVLKRMSIEECIQVTKGRFQSGQWDGLEEQTDSNVYTFDVNSLYSNSSSEETDSDTDYKPSRQALRRWFRDLLPT